MYGMVNRALKTYLQEAHGHEAWERVRAASGLQTDLFISMQHYPDEVTYGLVGAAVETLDVPAGDLLQAFGRYWVGWARANGYDDLLRLSGGDLPELLSNLDALHTRIRLTLPALAPPSFRLEREAEGTYLLHYGSQRAGLTPFVTGLVHGAADMFGCRVQVELVSPRPTDDGEDVFRVTIDPDQARP